jgi:Xaa-Pro aminopeptidase
MPESSAASRASPVFAERRARLAQRMGRGIAIIPTAAERARNRDSHYPYRYDSYFYYLTGFTEPDAVLVIVAGSSVEQILFCRDKDTEREIWDGYRYGPAAACELFRFNRCYTVGELDARLPELIANQPQICCHLGADEQWDARVLTWVNAVRQQVRTGVSAPAAITDVHTLLDEMRLTKDSHELGLMRRAAEISTGAHVRAMRATAPGRAEFEIEAELLHEFRRGGAQAPAYTPIVAGGANACVLHYVANNSILNPGDLILIDAGCELDGYASDITRTFPVSGQFTTPQREIYELVLAAQSAAISEVKPGASWNAPHDAAVAVLAAGFIELGLCTGTVEEVIESGDYKKYYMHRTGHWLGLDVHDAGDYKRDGDWRRLEPGMVLTVEPGCYIRPADSIPARYANIGVRIEDDVLVTATGNEVLTRAAPKTVDAIQTVMRG